MSKVTKEQYIKDLEHDIDMLATMVLDLRMENAELKDRLVEGWRISNILTLFLSFANDSKQH